MSETNAIAEAALALKTIRSVEESQAVIAIGAAIKILDKATVTAEEILTLCEERVKGNLQTLSNDEKLMLLALRYIRKKNAPYKLPIKPVSRNAACPCGSGKKYKFCCLDLVNARNWEAYHNE